MSGQRFILLSFDVEEFDIPLDHGIAITEDEQMRVGNEGLKKLMSIIEKANVEASFFTTANFGNHFTGDIKAISQQHEIASHTFYHSRFDVTDLERSRVVLENITGKKVTGLRMPRMQAVKIEEVANAGYLYDASVNPTFIPGRYNNLNLPRTVYKEENLLRIPASVTPNFRVPLFWLAFKNFPYSLYRKMVKKTLETDGYVCLYFHPWEFTELHKYKVPGYIKRGAGIQLQNKLTQLINDLKVLGEFVSIHRYLAEKQVDEAGKIQ